MQNTAKDVMQERRESAAGFPERESDTLLEDRQTPLEELMPSCEGISDFTLFITTTSYHAYKIGHRRGISTA
jgi:hypothetical protein